MARPGTEITIIDTAVVVGALVDTGTFFVVGTANRGAESPISVSSMNEFEQKLGLRQSDSYLWDTLDIFFREGGSIAYVSRVLGAAAQAATVAIPNAGSDSAIITANSKGDWGNSLSAQIVVGPTLQINDTVGILERSPVLVDVSDAVKWSERSDYVIVTDGGADLPAPGAAVDLAGGSDDSAGLTDERWNLALNRFSDNLGPGQIAMPGRTIAQGYQDLMNHAGERNRIALLDASDTGVKADLIAAADALNGAEGERYSAMFSPWIKVSGFVAGTVRTVPPCAVVAGLIAQNDFSDSPGVAAAGTNGYSRTIIDLSQEDFGDSDRTEINAAGINLFRILYTQPQLYGYRTLTDPTTDPEWIQLTTSRLLMAIRTEVNRVADEFVFAQIDGRGRTISAFGGAITGIMLGYWNAGSLYGEDPQDAFVVDVSSSVNTLDTLRNGELRAEIGIKISPFAEFIKINIVRSSITEVIGG